MGTEEPDEDDFDPDAFLAGVNDSCKVLSAQKAKALAKDVQQCKRTGNRKATEREQTLTGIEELWESLCAKGDARGDTLTTLSVQTFIDVFQKCRGAGLESKLTAAFNPKSPDIFLDLEPRDVAYICYLIFEGHDPTEYRQQVKTKRSELYYEDREPLELLLSHEDKPLRLPQFRQLVRAIADVMQLGVEYVMSSLVWVVADRFEMPEHLYEQFFLKNNANRFLAQKKGASDAKSAKSAKDHEHVSSGQLETNDFFHLCHALELIDAEKKSGRSYESLTQFWDDMLRHIREHVAAYVSRRPGCTTMVTNAAPAAKKKAAKAAAAPRRRCLEGRTELTVMLELLVKQMPSARFKSPLNACYVFIFDNTVDVGEALAHVRTVCLAFDAADGEEEVDQDHPNAIQRNNTKKAQSMQSLFEERDKDASGELDFDELAALLRKGNPAMPTSQIKTLFKLADVDGSGTVDLKEFMALIGEERKQPQTKEDLKREFHKRDKDGSGTLDKEELGELLRAGKPDMTDAQISALFDGADVNKDGALAFDEFIDFIFKGSSPSAPAPKAKCQAKPAQRGGLSVPTQRGRK